MPSLQQYPLLYLGRAALLRLVEFSNDVDVRAAFQQMVFEHSLSLASDYEPGGRPYKFFVCVKVSSTRAVLIVFFFSLR